MKLKVSRFRQLARKLVEMPSQHAVHAHRRVRVFVVERIGLQGQADVAQFGVDGQDLRLHASLAGHRQQDSLRLHASLARHRQQDSQQQRDDRHDHHQLN